MNYSKSSVEITCESKDFLKLESLTDFQGDLKYRTEQDYQKIIKSLEHHGFSVPFFVWRNDGKNFVLDGHGRLGALTLLKQHGITIPDLPVVYVNCNDRTSAKKLLLKLNSSFGRMTKETVLQFIDGDINLNVDDYELPSNKLAIFNKISERNFEIPTNIHFEVPQDNPMFTPVQIKNEESKINNQNIERGSMPTLLFRYFKIKFCSSENEYAIFKKIYDEYVKQNNTDKGFIYAVLHS